MKTILIELPSLNLSGLLELIMRFTLNLGVIMVLIRWLYYTGKRRKDYLFTYVSISTIIFLICYLLANVNLQVGFALGMFAIFGIIRYRTSAISIKEMTYLFLIIGVSVINALANFETSLSEVIFSNLAIILITFGLEKIWLLRHESEKTIIYDRLELIKPDRYEELTADLVERTGIMKINKISVGKVDYVKNQVTLTIYFEINGDDPGNGIVVENSKDDIDD